MAGRLRREIPEGLRSRYNGSGSDIAAKLAVKQDTTVNQVVLPAANTDPLLGVTFNAIANGEWGTIQTRGQAVCTSGGAITVGARVSGDTTGKIIAYGAGQNVLGIALTAAAGADEDVEVELAGPAMVKA